MKMSETNINIIFKKHLTKTFSGHNVRKVRSPGMEIARVSSRGQITIPHDIREKMNLKKGDKIIFVEDNGKYFLQNYNASAVAIINAQKAFEGAAKDFDVNSEEDVQRLVNEVRYGEKRHLL